MLLSEDEMREELKFRAKFHLGNHPDWILGCEAGVLLRNSSGG